MPAGSTERTGCEGARPSAVPVCLRPCRDNALSDAVQAAVAGATTTKAAAVGRSVKLIEGTIEPTALEATAPPALEPPKPKSRLMLAADAAVRPRERKPRKVPSPAGT